MEIKMSTYRSPQNAKRLPANDRLAEEAIGHFLGSAADLDYPLSDVEAELHKLVEGDDKQLTALINDTAFENYKCERIAVSIRQEVMTLVKVKVKDFLSLSLEEKEQRYAKLSSGTEGKKLASSADDSVLNTPSLG
jgi:hypothetical protein